MNGSYNPACLARESCGMDDLIIGAALGVLEEVVGNKSGLLIRCVCFPRDELHWWYAPLMNMCTDILTSVKPVFYLCF